MGRAMSGIDNCCRDRRIYNVQKASGKCGEDLIHSLIKNHMVCGVSISSSVFQFNSAVCGILLILAFVFGARLKIVGCGGD